MKINFYFPETYCIPIYINRLKHIHNFYLITFYTTDLGVNKLYIYIKSHFTKTKESSTFSN